VWVLEPTFCTLINIEHGYSLSGSHLFAELLVGALRHSPIPITRHLSRSLCRTLPTGAQHSRQWVAVCRCAVTEMKWYDDQRIQLRVHLLNIGSTHHRRSVREMSPFSECQSHDPSRTLITGTNKVTVTNRYEMSKYHDQDYGLDMLWSVQQWIQWILSLQTARMQT
jgi:hypothetical protein